MRVLAVLLYLGLCTVACSPSEEQQATRQVTAPREVVTVKYRGPVDLAPFDCEWVTRSSVVERLCYDSKEQYVIVSVRGTYYHYCEVPADIVSGWREADSTGRYYDAEVNGRFDCRVNRMPSYDQ